MIRLIADPIVRSTNDVKTCNKILTLLKYGKENRKWQTDLYSDKCNVLSVTRNKKPIKYNYTLPRHHLEMLKEVEYSDITIRQDLKWKSHVKYV
jgi:hypothetical protein